MESVLSTKTKINKFCLLLVGGRPSQINHLKRTYHRLGLNNNVEFAGWTNFNQIPSYINLSTLCIIPHKKNGHTDTTIPHKLFQYMLFEKPVIVTNCLPLERIIRETKCGIIVKSDNSRCMANAIMNLYNNPKLAKKFGKNGKIAVINKYNWKIEEKKLLKIYEKIQIG
jgi:glycosyltransferase involved in cell wall biosynthesis